MFSSPFKILLDYLGKASKPFNAKKLFEVVGPTIKEEMYTQFPPQKLKCLPNLFHFKNVLSFKSITGQNGAKRNITVARSSNIFLYYVFSILM